MTQQQEDLFSFRNILAALDPTQSTLIAAGTYDSNLSITTTNQQNTPHPLLQDKLIKRGIHGIKTVLCRTSMCYVLTVSGHLLEITEQMGMMEQVLDFLEPNEKIINISAGYSLLLIVLQDQYTLKTRVFGKLFNSYSGFNYAAQVQKHAQIVYPLTKNDVNPIVSEWNEILDFQQILDVDENIIFTSCAAYTATFISSKGRIFAAGSNQFGEAGQAVTSYRNATDQCQIKECRIENLNHSKDKPFFVRSVNGDHTIIALTRDHRVYYCGYTLDKGGKDLSILREFKSKNMDSDEYFIDIASGYYMTLLLTNKHNLYMLESKEKVNLPSQENITSCRIFAAPYLFFIVVNDSTIFTFKPKSNSMGCALSVQAKPHHSLYITGSDKVVMYWKHEDETRSVRRMKETLLKSLNIDFLQDIKIVHL